MLKREGANEHEFANLTIEAKTTLLWDLALQRVSFHDNIRIAPGISGDVSSVKFREALPGEFIVENGYIVNLPEGIPMANVAGRFALEIFDTESGEVAAALGFDLVQMACQLVMNIAQTPQGYSRRTDLSRKTQRSIRSILSAEFRRKLLISSIDLARLLNVAVIYATSAERHRNVVSDRLSLADAVNKIDVPLVDVGFRGGKGKVPFYYNL